MPDLDLSVDLAEPASYPPVDLLERECDLVMKGGITSGVVYPRAVCQLATDHRIRNVGGSSAGAIAAGAAAAAERGRASGGFVQLAELADWLASPSTSADGTNLYNLFQPQKETRALHRLATAFIRRGSLLTKAGRGLVGVVLGLRLVPVLVLLVPAAILLGAAIVGSDGVGIAAAAIVALVAVVGAVLWSTLGHVLKGMPKNGFGLCSGLRTPGSAAPGLTEWLTDVLDEIAAVPSGPLTFGDLSAAGVELAMLTTDLTDGTQQRLPFGHRVWGFSPDEMRRLFPERVVQAMVDHPAPIDQKTLERFTAAGLHPLPDPQDLPVVVGVRMSLSFPALLSAVPLHRIDFGPTAQPIVRHWFSDGGITSNFPLHFFDNPLPTRPTFAVNLGPTTSLDDDQCQNIVLADSNLAGILEPPRPLETMVQFGNRLKDCLQNWADNAQTHVPGYRDRIVKVLHSKSEGGMNLDMGPTEVAALAQRGRCAGAALQQRFDFTNHRWVRYRSFMQAVEDLLEEADNGHGSTTPTPTYTEMIAGPPPGSYRTQWNPQFGATHTDALVAWAQAVAGSPHGFGDGAPNPRPRLQLRPDHPRR
jgi:predicted acylesterase/phospholipase RssA